MIDVATIEHYLETGLEIVQKAAPLAAAAGPAAGAWGELIANAAGQGDLVVKALSADADVIGSGDLTRIKALQAQLHAENAQLAAQIDAS